LSKYLQQDNLQYVLLHLSTKLPNDARVRPNEIGLTTFILSGAQNLENDQEIVDMFGWGDVLEFGNVCPPNCWPPQ
jgi:hypothetical protein